MHRHKQQLFCPLQMDRSWALCYTAPSHGLWIQYHPQNHHSPTTLEVFTHISQLQNNTGLTNIFLLWYYNNIIFYCKNCKCSGSYIPLLFSSFILFSSCRLLLSSMSALNFHSFNQLSLEEWTKGDALLFVSTV